ncbi:unnamed protein product, partial [Candidula unifasciata]
MFIGRCLTICLLLLSVVLFCGLGLMFNTKTTADVANCPCLEITDRQLAKLSPDKDLNQESLPGHVTSLSSGAHLAKWQKEQGNITATGPNKFQPNWWRSHTRRTCQKLGLNTSQNALTPSMLASVLVDKNHMILYCQIAKVASTNLGKIFAILAGKFNGTDPNAIKSSDVHWVFNKLQTHLDVFPKHVMQDMLKRYFKFTFVRDPFERLLSGYRNKFLQPSSSYFTYINKRLVLKYRKNSTQTGGVTFPEFVSYLLDKERKVPMNRHWQPMYEICRPCETSYNFIGKINSLEEDVSHILEINNLTGIIDISKLPKSYSPQKSDHYLGHYYSQVPRPLLLLLFQMYYADYAIL